MAYVAFDWTAADPTQGWVVGTFARSTWIKPGVFEYPIALGTDGVVYFHEKGQSAGGAVLTSLLDSSYFDVDDGNNLMMLKRIVPDFEGQNGAVNFTIKVKSFPNAAERTIGTYASAPNTEKIDLRTVARQMKMTLTASSSPSFWRMGGPRVDTEKSGSLR